MILSVQTVPFSFCLELSAMIQGAEDGSNFVVKHYKEEEAKDILKNYITSKFRNVWNNEMRKKFFNYFACDENQILILVLFLSCVYFRRNIEIIWSSGMHSFQYC